MNKRAKTCITGYASLSLIALTMLLTQQGQIQAEIKQVKSNNEKIQQENDMQLKKLEDELLKIEENIRNEKLKYIEELEDKIAYLKQDVIYKSSDVSVKANVTAPQLYRALEKLSPESSTLKELAWVISEACTDYGVNELFLAALIAQETGYGTSRRFIQDNNVGGYEVYTPKSKGRLFTSREESVRAVAKLLGIHYLDKEGMYYEGKSARDVNTRYCTSSEGGQYEWSKNINKIAYDIKEAIEEDKKLRINELTKELEDKTNELKEDI